MRHRNPWLILILLFALALQLVGCGAKTNAYEKVTPYTLEKGEDGINTITITEKAAERLKMASAPVVEEQIDGKNRLVVAYAALIYDNNGGTWVYTNPAALTYKRAEVAVDFIEGDKVFLTAGPNAGTQVAVTSVAELYGADTGVK